MSQCPERCHVPAPCPATHNGMPCPLCSYMFLPRSRTPSDMDYIIKPITPIGGLITGPSPRLLDRIGAAQPSAFRRPQATETSGELTTNCNGSIYPSDPDPDRFDKSHVPFPTTHLTTTHRSAGSPSCPFKSHRICQRDVSNVTIRVVKCLAGKSRCRNCHIQSSVSLR
jgi:hypothetical protein